MNKNKGISLLEVLVALVVLSVGLLGVASLQGLSKRANHEAHQRTLATYLADEIIERMRANITEFKTIATNGKATYETILNNKYHTGTTALGGGTQSTPGTLCINGTICNDEELATYDLWQWELAIDGASIRVDTDGDNVVDANAGGLVNPKACIIQTTQTGKFKIIIAWQSLDVTTDADVSGAGQSCSTASGEGNTRQMVIDTFI